MRIPCPLDSPARLLPMFCLGAMLWLAPSLRAADAATQFKALIAEHEKAEAAAEKAIRAAAAGEPRQKVQAAETAKMRAFAPRFLELAEQNPKSASALEALVWVCENGQSGAAYESACNAFIRDHVTHPRMAEVCEAMNPFMPVTETLLRAILEKNPRRDAQAAATLGLALVFKTLSEEAAESRRRSPAEQRAQIERATEFYGKEIAEKIFTRIRAADPTVLAREAEKHYELVLEKFADVGGRRGPAVKAKGELFELRNLALGKVAPEIEGEDLAGKKFKLSEYRGKVVVIDFFGDW